MAWTYRPRMSGYLNAVIASARTINQAKYGDSDHTGDNYRVRTMKNGTPAGRKKQG